MQSLHTPAFSLCFRDVRMARRMVSTLQTAGLGRPHEILMRSPPPPPHSPVRAHDQPLVVDIARRASPDAQTLAKMIRRLSRDLRCCHRFRVPHFPTDGMHNASKYDEEILVGPVLELLSRLRRPFKPSVAFQIQAPQNELKVFTMAMVEDNYVQREFNDGPTLIFVPAHYLAESTSGDPDSLRLPANLADRVRSEAERGKVILCTDRHRLFFLRRTGNSSIVFESVELHNSLATLRVIIAACVHASLPDDYLANPWQIYWIVPAGCIISPEIPLQTNHEVFRTHRSHADFDFYTLNHDKQRALQFFDWKGHALSTPPTPLAPGQRLQAHTNAFDQQQAELRPFYPKDDLSQDVIEHISDTRRVNPLEALGLQSSTTFEIDIVSDLTPQIPPAAERDASVYRCRLVSVDGNTVTQTGMGDLCVKLYDDRQADVERPDDRMLAREQSMAWWRDWSTSVHSVRQEHGIYRRLGELHGSLLPWYYGAHQFSLPDGRKLYGILMEFVDAPTLHKLAVASLSKEEQVQFIKSARKIVSALQSADVSQRDWHCEQLLCLRSPQAGLHAVLIDLTRCSTAVDPHVLYAVDDVDDCAQALDTLPANLVNAHFRWREEWDTKKSYTVQDAARDPYDIFCPQA